MQRKRLARTVLQLAMLFSLPIAFQVTHGQASPYRGLWIGSATLNAVNEVSIPLDAANVPIAPESAVPTSTFDHANLRLLLHVNGAGQISLLKDVAILNRAAGVDPATDPSGSALESDLALVTDPRVYPEFPPQPAVRLASVAFDFGDANATEALDALVEETALLVTAVIMDPALEVSTQGQRVQARNDAVASATPVLAELVEYADVAQSFDQFLIDFNKAPDYALDAIALDPEDPIVDVFLFRAAELRDQSFYGDTRALEMVQAVVAAVQAADPAESHAAAHNTAASFADVENLSQRFISGKTFGDMIQAAALEATVAAKEPGVTEATILNALRTTPESMAALTEALLARVQIYDDTRSRDAADAVLAAMAVEAQANAAQAPATIRLLSEQAGRAEQVARAARYPLPAMTPTVDYNTFVQSVAFADAAGQAALASADAAIGERAGNPLYTEQSVYAAAQLAAMDALQPQYNTAARAMRTELPLTGVFGPGSGDPRPVRELTHPGDLGPAGLVGRIYLPANHPTNPFRHRRHPDHTTGFNIERLIRFDFDGGEGDALDSAGYGVERITGAYREEIFGLHKPLGPAPDSDPIGLKTEGRFELQRISLIDTLNTR